jgi:two-component system sensor histidine kinase MtrB
MADQIGTVSSQLAFPPDQVALDRLRLAVGDNTLVTYQQLRSASGAATGLVTEAIRTAVRTQHRMVAQRIVANGKPWLLIGTPVTVTALDGSRTASGVEVYTVQDLTSVEQQTDALARSAIATAALALLPAVLLALLAARSVLKPVRELRDTARKLAKGDLSARTPPKGADELAELTVTVNEMAESLQSSMAAKERMQADARRFAADVAHELRTPLSTLTAVTDVLATSTEGMDSDARESAQLAIAETYRLVRLVEDLMEVSRFDAGTAQLRRERVNLADAVRDCLRTRGWFGRAELRVSGDIWLPVDRRRLDVILANLVGNAFRHGEVPVRVQVSERDDQVWIEVVDSGPGLPEAVLPHVFDRFYKAGQARTRSPGSGLGLAIALENARLHGGDLTAGNATGGGARFVVRLPRTAEES